MQNWFMDEICQWILSMGSRKAAVLDQVRAGRTIRVEHLLKLYFYPEAEYERNGWVESVWKVLPEIEGYHKNKLPPFKLLMEELWGIPYSGSMRGRLPNVIKKFANNMTDYKPIKLPLSDDLSSHCVLFLERFHGWLANELSTVGSVSMEDVGDKISSMLRSDHLETIQSYKVK